MSHLVVDDLVVRYGETQAVAGVSFALDAGEHLALLGPSGCGKTTTLRAVAGLERPARGRIALDGTVLCDVAGGLELPPERRGLAMVFQSYAIWPHMSVFDNVAFPLKVRGAPRAEVVASVERALGLVGLSGLAGRPATNLSGGQQQRVAVARAIAGPAKLLLFDEPLSNLDAQLRVQMRGELSELCDRLGLAALYVTHDQTEAFALADRIIVMREGRIEQIGTPAEVHGTPRTRFVANFIGMNNIFEAELARATEQGQAIAKLADGTVLQARDPWRDDGTDRPSNRGWVAFRPGSVALADGHAAPGGTATVVRSHFLGDTTQVRLRAGPLELLAERRLAAPLGAGAPVAWRVDPADCLVLRS